MTRGKTALLGENMRKLQPKLRMVANGSTEVNAMRSTMSGSVAVTDQNVLKRIEAHAEEVSIPLAKSKAPGPLTRGKQTALPANVLASVFIQTTDVGERNGKPPVEVEARRANLATAVVPVKDLRKLSADPDVAFVEMGEALAMPTPIVSNAKVGAPDPALRRFSSSVAHHSGQGVLIGVIDVQGFDFAHPDFLDDKGETRFVRIWDQGGDTRPSPGNQAPFNYGAEFHQKDLNAAIKKAPSIGVPPQELERQSQMAESSHATHVASIAAGNRGVCRKAMIAGVLISLPASDNDRRRSFYDSTRIAHAVDYLIRLAEELGNVPLSINISLGTNGHAHDASAAISRWIDSSMAVPGRCVCVAAGNAGQEIAEFEGDLGYVMGRIHTSGQVAAAGLNRDIDWVVVGNGRLDISENEMELWFHPQDRFAISVRPPGGDWIGPVEPRQFIENRQLPDGSFVSIYNELYHPANGANYISAYLSPFLSATAVIGVPAGQWTVRLHAREIRDGRYHAWIERDDPRRLGRVGVQEAWRFPSFFSEKSNVDNSSVSSLACGQRIISVANLDRARDRINITSSQGPTRDGRSKPDVAAPGTDIVAANGFAGEDKPWVAMTGTSMASPFVCGVAGLMLAVEPKLTSAQIEGIIHRTSRPLPGADFTWLNDAGFGAIDPEACLAEAALVNQREDLT